MAPMDRQEIQKFFLTTVQEKPDLSPAVAAVESLIEFLTRDTAETMAELRKNLKEGIDFLCQTDSYITGTSISSGCELFLRFITLAALDHSNFEECKRIMIERGMVFLHNVASSRSKIAGYFHPFIRDGATILVHSKSRVVYQALVEAAKHRKRFHVYVTEAGPDKSGVEMHRLLIDAGIPSTVILDAAVGYIMEKVDLMVMGAEGVVESGGIINKIGSFSAAIAAKEHNKPVFVLSESFKFVRLFPLNQRDVPNHFKLCRDPSVKGFVVLVAPSILRKILHIAGGGLFLRSAIFDFRGPLYAMLQEKTGKKLCERRKYNQATLLRHTDLSKEHPQSDYTPPSFITLLFSDLGILTPSAVSDELIRLYL